MRLDYARISERYDSFRSFPEVLRKRICEAAGLGEGSRVLDIGCGTGNASVSLSRRPGAWVVGLDKSEAMLAKAGAKGVPVVCADADGFALPFKDASFDAAIGIYILHHIRERELLFRECRRVLKAGPLVLLTASHAQIEDQHPAIRRFFPSFIAVDKARFPDVPVVERELKQAGFADVKFAEFRVERIPLDEGFVEKVRNKYISTYELIPQEEFRSGLRELERYVRELESPEYRKWQATLAIAGTSGHERQ